MHNDALQYVKRFSSADRLSVAEIGSRNINGTARVWFPNADWIGLDIVDGPGVDIVIDAEAFQPTHAVDLVVCCEVFEHTPRWRQIITAAAGWLKPGGRMIVTCAGPGRRPHSASGRRKLDRGEYYSNVGANEMREAMVAAGLSHVVAEVLRNDCYATAITPENGSRTDKTN